MQEGIPILDQMGSKDLPLKVASKLRLGVDLSLTILLLHTKIKTTYFLMCGTPFQFYQHGL